MKSSVQSINHLASSGVNHDNIDFLPDIYLNT